MVLIPAIAYNFQQLSILQIISINKKRPIWSDFEFSNEKYSNFLPNWVKNWIFDLFYCSIMKTNSSTPYTRCRKLRPFMTNSSILPKITSPPESPLGWLNGRSKYFNCQFLIKISSKNAWNCIVRHELISRNIFSMMRVIQSLTKCFGKSTSDNFRRSKVFCQWL